MTDLQINKAIALGKCRFPVGSNQKRFAHNMRDLAHGAPKIELTEKQAKYLDLLFHQYRRQIPKSHKKWCDCEEAKREREQMELKVEEE